MKIKHRTFIWFAIILIVTMASGAFIVSAATRPGTESAEPAELQYRCEEMHVMNGDVDLYGEMYLPLEEKELYPTVILSHGLGSNGYGMAGQAKLFAKNGYAAYVYDINEGSIVSRSGKADKDMTHLTPLTAVSDLEAVVDHIRELPYVDTDHLFLSGASFGGLISAYLSGMRPDDFKGILLQSAAFSIPEEYKEQYPSPSDIPETIDVRGMILGRPFIEDACAMDIYSVISNYKGDVLLCHGDADDTVDISYAEKAAGIYENCKFVVYEGAGHSFAGKFKPVNDEEMLNFLQAHLE